MKKYLIIILLLAAQATQACDVCGCKLGGLYFGILPRYSNHFVGLRYSYSKFDAAMRYNSDYLQDETSSDTYQKIDLMGRFVLNEKFQLNVILPYLVNEMNGSHQNVSANGLGDPMLILYFQPFNNANSITNGWKHALQVGAGLKLPLGEHDAIDQGELINRNFQLGSGSIDYLLSLNYTVRKNAIGLNIESSYKLNTANSDDYQFGNQFNLSSYAFYWKEFNSFTLLPYSGMFFEQAGKHTNNGFEEINTGGYATFGTVGLQVYKGNFTFNLLYQIPINQQFNSERIASIEAGDRASLGVIFNIPKKIKTGPIPTDM